MAHTTSNRQASRFVGCDYNTYVKYAKRYIDSETGKTLYELHSNQGHKGVKIGSKNKNSISILDVLKGKHPEFPPAELKSKVLREGLMIEECEYCGFNERRITDGSVPLVMIWKDGNFQNHVRDNLELVCYNHYFLMYDDIFEKAETIDRKCKGYYDS